MNDDKKKPRDISPYTDVALEACRQVWQEFEDGADPGFAINFEGGTAVVQLVLDLVAALQVERAKKGPAS